MKAERPKLKSTPRPLFSCSFFSHCTQSVISPTAPITPSLPPPPPPSSHHQSHPSPPPPPPPDSESSSSSTSQSFTQWRFPLPNSPILHHPHPPSQSHPSPTHHISPPQTPPPPPIPIANLQELFHVAELQLSTGSDVEKLAALQLLERSLVPAAGGGGDEPCPAAVMRGVVGCLKDRAGARPATKVLLALCLAEGNRHVAVEAGAVAEVVEAMPEMEGAVAERALAALELMCTVAEGAAELRAHALSVPMMVSMMENMAGRGKECAISILAVIFIGAGDQAPPSEEVARAVVLALQGDCSARGRRKGAQLLKALQDEDEDEEEEKDNGKLELLTKVGGD